MFHVSHPSLRYSWRLAAANHPPSPLCEKPSRNDPPPQGAPSMFSGVPCKFFLAMHELMSMRYHIDLGLLSRLDACALETGRFAPQIHTLQGKICKEGCSWCFGTVPHEASGPSSSSRASGEGRAGRSPFRPLECTVLAALKPCRAIWQKSALRDQGERVGAAPSDARGSPPGPRKPFRAAKTVQRRSRKPEEGPAGLGRSARRGCGPGLSVIRKLA